MRGGSGPRFAVRVMFSELRVVPMRSRDEILRVLREELPGLERELESIYGEEFG